MSITTCCVPGCSPTSGMLILHGFPHPVKEKERFDEWVFNIGGEIMTLSNDYIYKHRKVCHQHFEAQYCSANYRISIKAVPTIMSETLDIGFETVDLNMEVYDSEGYAKSDPLKHSTTPNPLMGIDDNCDVNLSTTAMPKDPLSCHKYSKSQKPAFVINKSPFAFVSTNKRLRKPLQLVSNSIEKTLPSTDNSMLVSKLVPLSSVRKCTEDVPTMSHEIEIGPDQNDDQNNVATEPTPIMIINKDGMRISLNEAEPNAEGKNTYIVQLKKLNSKSHKTDAAITNPKVRRIYAVKSKAEIEKLNSQLQNIDAATNPKLHKIYAVKGNPDAVKLNTQHNTNAGKTVIEVPKTYVNKLKTETVKLNTQLHKTDTGNTNPEATTTQYVINSKSDILKLNNYLHGIDADKINTEVQRTGVIAKPVLDITQSKGDKRNIIGDNFKYITSRMTSNELHIYKQLVAVKVQLRKCKNKLSRQEPLIKAGKKLMTNPAFLKALNKLPHTAKILTSMQFRECGKKNRAHRFTEEEKKLALSIMKRSIKMYRMMRKMFILPDPKTLTKLCDKTVGQPTIDKNDAIAQLRSQADKMKVSDRLCVLLFDERTIIPILSPKQKKDSNVELVTEDDTPIKVAQVFMVRGILKNYCHPVSCTFLPTVTWAQELAVQIKGVISELQGAGFTVLATVCRQGENNRDAIEILTSEAKSVCMITGNSHNDNSFFVNDKEIITLYDPPHLLKAIRDSLLTKNLMYEYKGQTRVAKWQHIEMLLKENPGYNGIPLVPKLTKIHVNPKSRLATTKVKFASQVFSQTVAKYMGFLAVKEILPRECEDTAEALLFFDRLFDSVNGSKAKMTIKNENPLLRLVKPSSPHHKVWKESQLVLRHMRFFDDQYVIDEVPTFDGWIWTLEGLEMLVRMLQNQHNVTAVWMRNLNQDPLEKFLAGK